MDAIVNAANTLMSSGGGREHYYNSFLILVNGHIRRLAGSELETEKVGTIGTGECIVTKGYNLPAKCWSFNTN